MLASSEARFETKALPLLKADNVLTDGIADIVSLQKAWLVCRGEVDSEESTAAGRLHFVEINFPLNTSETTQISEAWVRTHGFAISRKMLLNENMIGQMWRELDSSQRTLMETLRIQSSIVPKTKAFVVPSKPGESMTIEEYVADEIGTSTEAYWRARAFFMTLTCVIVLDQTFFSLQDAFVHRENFSLVQMTVDGRRPPPSFFAAARRSLLQRFADDIRSEKNGLCCL